MGRHSGEHTDQGRERQQPLLLLYHHARPLDHSPCGSVKQERGLDADFEGAYRWIEHHLGFYPLFLAVGATEDDMRMTGYQNQWRKKLGDREYRRKGEIDNYVLFSFSDVPNSIFTDFHYWHIVLNGGHSNYQISNWAKKLIFRPTWDRDRWLGYARRKPHSVQLIVPELDISRAERIWVRNRETKKHLEGLEFANIAVRRLVLGGY